MKQTIRLNESQFNSLVNKVVKESVKKVINENEEPLTWLYMRNTLNLMLKALENRDVEQLTARNANLQRLITKIGSQQPQQPMQQQYQVQPQQPMQQQSQVQQQPTQKQQQGMSMQQQQPTNANNNTMVDNQVQQQMQKNMALQQQMADRIRQQKMSKYNTP